ncbi:hypothetical protein IP90_00935 [Luteimonas cucumeris]|uniref:Pectate lyase-like protein n=1 Tax=Luteimonas cucumeris TaxID=985012 RepID=A0A562LAW4_9GAMM|nr:hypothetical protein [Luteimonas cucumeris]TWI04797.1 hypothetical protein IP90_00935 [Luteimonas cucumeris]
MAALLSPSAKQQFFDNAGNPASGFKLYTYAANTLTPQATYTNRAGTVSNTNPIILDARGEAIIYLNPEVIYDYVLHTAADVPVWTREDVSASAGDASAVAFTQSGSGAVIRTLQARLLDSPLYPTDFGAVGDGVADDTLAVQTTLNAAVAQSRTIDWGDLSKVYLVTSTLSLDLAGIGLRWIATGATIKYGGTHVARVFDLNTAVGCPVVIEGPLTIDANMLANNALWIGNTADGSSPSHYQDATITDLTVTNMYRKDATFAQSADGVFIRGAWNRVTLTRPTAKNSILAAGAGSIGVFGAFGITVANQGARAFRYCSIVDATVENISSEDPAYLSDQDGLRLFDAGDSVSHLYPNESFVSVRGGQYKNCRNRSIKVQANYAQVSNIGIVRNDPPTGGVGSQADIDMQVGGGSVDGVDCLYDAHVPSAIVQFTDTSIVGKVVPACTAKNIRVVNHGAVTLPVGIIITGDEDTGQRVFIDTVDIRGLIDKAVTWRISSPDDAMVIVKNVLCAPTTCFASCVRGVAMVVNNQFYADSCVNLGAAVPFFIKDSASSTLLKISANGCFGWTDGAGMSSGELNQPAMLRVDAIGGNNDATSGTMRPRWVSLANGASVQMPRSSLVGNCGFILIVTHSNAAEDQALFAVDHNSLIPIAITGTTWVAGTTADPGSGTYRIWGGGTTGGDSVWIKNNSGVARSFTVFMFG